jgi:hypothetical protein
MKKRLIVFLLVLVLVVCASSIPIDNAYDQNAQSIEPRDGFGSVTGAFIIRFIMRDITEFITDIAMHRLAIMENSSMSA